jgi:hypothetical protein
VVDGLFEPFAGCGGASSMDDAQSRCRRDIPGTAQCCLGCKPRPEGQNCARRDLHGGQLVAQESGFVYLVKWGDASGKHTPRRRRVPRTRERMGSAALLGQGEDTAAAPAQVPREGIIVGK